MTVSFAASAQDAFGPGARAGNLELHPGLAGQVGYDSNYFQRAGNGDPDEEVVGAIRFRITPSFSVRTLGQDRGPGGEPAAKPKVSFSARLSASYNELVATDSDFSEDVRDQRHVSAQAGMKLDILPGRTWGGDILLDFVRAIEPSNSPGNNSAFDRDTLRYGGGVRWSPGGGLFTWRLGYEGNVTFFERNQFTRFNNIQHFVKTRGRWRFYPRTALLFDASYGFINYTNNTGQDESTPVRIKIGMNGLVTKRFAVLALIGWGASFYDEDPGQPQNDFDSVIAQAELKWFVQPAPDLDAQTAPVGLSSIALGFTRDFSNSFLANFFVKNRVYLKVDYQIANRFQIDVSGGYSRIHHPANFVADPAGGGFTQQGGTPLDEDRIDAKAFLEYRVTDSFGVNLTGQYDASLGEKEVGEDPANIGALVLTDDISFDRFQAYLGARWSL